MEERIGQELEVLRIRFPDLEYKGDGHWLRIPSYPLPAGWSKQSTEVAFQIPVGYPGTPPYGIYTVAGLKFCGTQPENYTEPAPAQPPFPGMWGVFSWALVDGQWRPTANINSGPNLLNWVLGFADRFREGR